MRPLKRHWPAYQWDAEIRALAIVFVHRSRVLRRYQVKHEAAGGAGRELLAPIERQVARAAYQLESLIMESPYGRNADLRNAEDLGADPRTVQA